MSHNIYLDEAGQTAKEPVTVVAGVIVEVATQWRATEQALQTVFDEMVPSHYRKGFQFHAKSIWGNPKYRVNWSRRDRLALIKRVIGLPHALLNLPIVVGKVRRDADFAFEGAKADPEMQHAIAFGVCVEKADYYLRNYRAPGHLGTVICESIPEMESKLVRIVEQMKANLIYERSDDVYITTPASRGVHPGLQDLKREATDRRGYHLDNIIDRPHFVPKGYAPILQIADGIAFAFRRWLSGQDGGEELIDSMGIPADINRWAGPLSQALYIPPGFALMHKDEKPIGPGPG